MSEKTNLIQGKYLTGVSSVVGDTRRQYEDRAQLIELRTARGLNLLVAIVADGVGSADNGGLAAQLSIDSVVSYMTESEETDIPLLITNSLKYANHVVYKDVVTRNVDASTTLIVGVFFQDRFYVGNVGDSRAYWIQESGKIIQLTMDHSYYNIKGGDPNSSQADALINAIGIRKEIFADVGLYVKGNDRQLASQVGLKGLPLKVGDTILLCSDGLIKDDLQGARFVKDEEIVHALHTEVQPNAAAVKMTGLAEGRYVDDNVSVVTVQHTTPESIENVLSKQRRKSLMQKLIYAGLGLIFLAGIITGAFLIKENRKTQSERDDLANILLTPNITELPPDSTPTPTQERIISPGQIQAMKVGYYDDKLGYKDYDIGGPDYPRWSVINSGSPELIRPDHDKQLSDELIIETSGNVGVMFSIGSQFSGGVQDSNNQFFVYGGTSLSVKNQQGVTDISLSEGGIYLKLTGRSEIANIVFPEHNYVLAKLTGGSGLLITDKNSVSFWCLSEECQFEQQGSDEVKKLQQGQIRVYDSLQGILIDPAENYSAPSERYQEYLHWNDHCNRCLPFDLVPEPTPTLVYFTPTPAPDRENVPAEPTPTATTEVAPTTYKLTVNVDGQGSVSLDPPGGTYNAGTVVTLTASPKDGWEFAGWDNGATSPTTTVTMNSDVSITARFTKKAPTMYTLSVGVEGDGQGTVTLNPPGGKYEAGTRVTLTANPKDGSEFAGWNPGGSSNPLIVTMDSDISITARFNKKAPTKYRLRVMSGQGGTVEPSGGTFDPGTSVTITAYPYDGYEVDSWSTGETTESITVVMDSDKTIWVRFKSIAKTISFSMPKLTGFVGNEGIVYSNNGSYEAVISSR